MYSSNACQYFFVCLATFFLTRLLIPAILRTGGDSLNERIKELRKNLNLTQEDFGAKISIKRASVSLLESGRNTPSAQTISMICDQFGVNRDWLVTGNGPMFQPRTMEDQLGDLFKAVALDPEDAFRKRIFMGLAKLNPEDWKTIEQLVDKMLSEQKKEGRD